MKQLLIFLMLVLLAFGIDTTVMKPEETLQKPITVAEGALGFKDCTFTTAAPIEVCQYAGVVTVLDQETNTTTPVTIASVTDWPIGVGLSTPYPESAGEPRYAVAKIPVAVKPSLAVEDLRNLTPREGQLPSLALEIETEGTDYMVYVRRVRSVVRRISNDPTLDYQDPANWSDGLAPHDDADYLVDNASTLCAASGDFSGGSLIAAALSGASFTGSFVAFFTHLRVHPVNDVIFALCAAVQTTAAIICFTARSHFKTEVVSDDTTEKNVL